MVIIPTTHFNLYLQQLPFNRATSLLIKNQLAYRNRPYMRWEYFPYLMSVPYSPNQ